MREHFISMQLKIREFLKRCSGITNMKAKSLQATERIYHFFFVQTDKLKIDRSVADHLLRTYRAFLEGFSLLVIHHSFGNPISIEESFEISLNVLLKGIEPYERRERNRDL